MRRCRTRAVIDFERALKNRDAETSLRGRKSCDNADGPGTDDDKFGWAAQRLVPCKISISCPA